MALPIWPFTVIFGLWTLLLVGTSVLLVYPTIKTPRLVLHATGIRELTLSLLLLTAGAIAEGTFWAGLTASPWTLTASRALLMGSGLALAAASWNFASPFLDPAEERIPEETWLSDSGDDE